MIIRPYSVWSEGETSPKKIYCASIEGCKGVLRYDLTKTINIGGVMKKSLIFLLAANLLVAGIGFADTFPAGKDILAELDKIRFPEQFFQRVTLRTLAPGEADKSMTLESSYKKGQGTYMEIQDPPRSKGTRFLNKEGSLWMFSPKSGSTKPIRLAPKDSFQGSAFSNSDVSKTTFSDDYSATVEAEETVSHPELGSVVCYRLRCDAAKPDASYGKIMMWLRKSDLIPLKFDYYAKSGLLYRKMAMSQYKMLAGRLRATHMEMESIDKVGTKSIITIEVLEERSDIRDSLFNLNNLTR
jgi:outer membrane lipoprotein-sorting protein